jgi:hypothetical protein
MHQAMRKAMQLALALPEPPAQPPVPAVAIDPQTCRTAQEILVRILAQAAETAKPQEHGHE